jgi:hypothetical protein
MLGLGHWSHQEPASDGNDGDSDVMGSAIQPETSVPLLLNTSLGTLEFLLDVFFAVPHN